jgi:hypothetical protein
MDSSKLISIVHLFYNYKNIISNYEHTTDELHGHNCNPSEATAVDQDPFPILQSGAQRTNTKHDYPTLTYRFISYKKID